MNCSFFLARSKTTAAATCDPERFELIFIQMSNWILNIWKILRQYCPQMIRYVLCEPNTIQISVKYHPLLPKYDEKQDEKGSDPLSWGDVACRELLPVAPGHEQSWTWSWTWCCRVDISRNFSPGSVIFSDNIAKTLFISFLCNFSENNTFVSKCREIRVFWYNNLP